MVFDGVVNMIDSELKAIIDFKKDWQARLLIVRVTTEYFKSKNGSLIVQKKIKPLKRKSTQDGLWCLEHDVDCGGVDYLLKGIINLNDVDDGVYEMKMVNITHDFESMYVDGWDWKLVKISVDN